MIKIFVTKRLDMKYGFTASFQRKYFLTDTYLCERAKALDAIMKILEETEIHEEYSFKNCSMTDIHLIAGSVRKSGNYNFARSGSDIRFVTDNFDLYERVRNRLGKDFVVLAGSAKLPYAQKIEPGNSVLHMLYLLFGPQ